MFFDTFCEFVMYMSSCMSATAWMEKRCYKSSTNS